MSTWACMLGAQDVRGGRAAYMTWSNV